MSSSVENLKRDAERMSGLPYSGPEYLEVSLAAWVEDLNHGPLSDVGKSFFAHQMSKDIARRLEVFHYLQRHPEIDEVKIPPIIYISGLERTGTTFLHNLLTLDPKARAFLRWELMTPIPAPDAASYTTDPRIAKTKAAVDRLRGSKLEHMHWVEADDPEECYWGLLNGFGILGGSAAVIMPRFNQTKSARSMRLALEEYRQVIKIILWKNPVPDGGHLVLKSPQLSGYLQVLLEVIPECRMALMHRDPYRALVSVLNLQAHIHEPFLSCASAQEFNQTIIDGILPFTANRLTHMLELDQSDVPVANISYPELLSDPLSAVKSIYQQHGLSEPPTLESAIAAFVAAQKAGKRAKPADDFIDFGIDPDELRRQPAMAAYCQVFHVETETVRQTGA